MKIACLHTAESNVAVFEAAAEALGIDADMVAHTVRADLLLAAERAGGLTPGIEADTSAALVELARDADVVLLTCSTVGPAVASAGNRASIPVLRVDGALAEKAVAAGGRVVVLCAVETTVGPTKAIFAEAAKGHDVSIEVRLVPDAWAKFRAGDRDGYLATVARAAEAAYAEGATTVALAQASMAGAAGLVRGDRKPLSSPSVGLAAALAMVSRQS